MGFTRYWASAPPGALLDAAFPHYPAALLPDERAIGVAYMRWLSGSPNAPPTAIDGPPPGTQCTALNDTRGSALRSGPRGLGSQPAHRRPQHWDALAGFKGGPFREVFLPLLLLVAEKSWSSRPLSSPCPPPRQRAQGLASQWIFELRLRLARIPLRQRHLPRISRTGRHRDSHSAPFPRPAPLAESVSP